MRILVLGGTGFIGRRVVAALRRHEVTVFHRGSTHGELPQVGHLYGRREELGSHRAALRALEPDVVLDMIPRNGPDARLVIDGIRGIASRLVAVSSGSVYRTFGILVGSEAGEVDNSPSHEESPLRRTLFPYRRRTPPTGEGGAPALHDYDKIPAERAYLQEPELACSIVRLPMVYGPGDPDHRIGPYARRMVDHRPVILLQEAVSRWRNARAFVDNAAAAIARVVEAGAPSRVYNVAEPHDFTEAEWVRRIGEALGWEGTVRLVADGGRLGRPPLSELPQTTNFAQHLTMDSTRIRDELGYAEVVSIDDALKLSVKGAADASPPIDYREEDDLLASP